jgi:mRNA-degrading endonuclease toxin of MazEF toxin-antitoxin module
VPLTSVRLIVLAVVLTAGALAATILLWRRGYLVRPAGVLLTEVLLTLSVGLVVNRSQQFYPSWAALFAGSDPGPPIYHTSAGRLDGWLAAQRSTGQAQSFPWRPTGWASWHLAGAPTVTVPAEYLAHRQWRYPAVVVLGERAPAVTGPTVLVSVTTTAATAAAALATRMPAELGRDLRVTGHRWALVTAAADNALARSMVARARGRFPAVAFVGTARPAVHRTAAELPSGVQTAYFPSATNALAWAAAQTPPPLAASAAEPAYLPPAPKRPHHAKPTPKPTPKAADHGTRQPRP